jgi:VanZ family protein
MLFSGSLLSGNASNATNAMNAQRLLPWLPALFYMGLIFIASSQPNLPALYEFPESDKLLHVLLYAPLGFLICYALSRSAPSTNLILFGSFLAFLCGSTDELHQTFVPGRNASLLDVLADGTGAIIGSFIYTKLPFGRSVTELTSELT